MLRIAWTYGIDYDVMFRQTLLVASTESYEIHPGNELGHSVSKGVYIEMCTCINELSQRTIF